MLNLYTYKEVVGLKNKETGLIESVEKERIGYFQSNKDEYVLCKNCLLKHNEDSEYKMNYRKHGSAYCIPCSEAFNVL